MKPVLGKQGEKYFRWRGKDVSRTENLSDIVFAMALALIVASSVPTSFTELTDLWREAIAIAICFALLLMIWHIHFVFFRRYDLEDNLTIFLNSVLMFLVMAFVYPLKFLFLFLINFFTGNFENQQDMSKIGSSPVGLCYILFGICRRFCYIYGDVHPCPKTSRCTWAKFCRNCVNPYGNILKFSSYRDGSSCYFSGYVITRQRRPARQCIILFYWHSIGNISSPWQAQSQSGAGGRQGKLNALKPRILKFLLAAVRRDM